MSTAQNQKQSAKTEKKLPKTEKIGSVTLNYAHYSGVDLYSDGKIEDELLQIVREHKPSEYPDVIERKASWPVLYHLSEMRGNIVDWLPMTGKEKVLEVGSGCGAVTATLARKAGSVTGVDLSRKRSLINATRNQEHDNIEIHVGNFRDIEPTLPADYDYIFLIGVFEYGQGYIGTDHPYENFLLMLMRHLKQNGRLVIAIENRLGLKYFAGAREDHLGTYFGGIEGYSLDSVARTFSKQGLIDILRRTGIQNYQFYYPYPDYKLMTTLYSDQRLPGPEELLDNVRNYDRARMALFNEKYAAREMLAEGLYPEFANSFEVVIGPGFPIQYCKYSNDRADEFKIRTEISVEAAGRRLVRKYPLGPAAEDHIRGMRSGYESMLDRFRGGDLEINDCQISDKAPVATFSYVTGTPLSELMDRCLFCDDLDGFRALFQEYMKRISYREDYPAADYDLIFDNILVNGQIWTIIDYEWVFGKRIPTRELAFRALYNYSLGDRRRNKLPIDEFYREIGLSEEDVERLLAEEDDFQKYVTGKHKAMVEMWKLIGCKSTTPPEMKAVEDPAILHRTDIVIYEDWGEGFSEEHFYHPAARYDDAGRVRMTLTIPEGVRAIRIDPANTECMVTVENMLLINVGIEPDAPEMKLTPNGAWLSDRSIVFNTADPGITVALDHVDLRRTAEDHLNLTMVMQTMTPSMAEDLAAYQLAEPEETPETTRKKPSWKRVFRKLF